MDVMFKAQCETQILKEEKIISEPGWRPFSVTKYIHGFLETPDLRSDQSEIHALSQHNWPKNHGKRRNTREWHQRRSYRVSSGAVQLQPVSRDKQVMHLK